MMYREPSDSPWGLVVRCDTLCPGVYSVSTAGHGGIMAQIDAARQLLSLEAQAVGFQVGRYLNFAGGPTGTGGQRHYRTPDG